MVGPLAEAAAKLGEPNRHGADQRYLVRVLEPAPPAVLTEPFADDPAAAPEPEAGIVRVGPVDGPFDRTWHELAADDAALRPWCAERWLGAWRPLTSAPDSFAATREQLHTLAEHVLTPVREHAVNRISLRWTRSGFGIPYLPGDVQLRLAVAEGSVHLVRSDPAGGRSEPLSTAAAAAAFAGTPLGATGVHYKPLTIVDPDAPFELDPAAAQLLADWFGFGTAILEQLRHDVADGSPGRVHLWPEHFDVAIEAGDEAAGGRASIGASPGDQDHPEPYLYVSPWNRRSGGFWKDSAFGGASLSLRELVAAGDGPAQRSMALAFFRRGYTELADGESVG
jgi:hypothetical protein